MNIFRETAIKYKLVAVVIGFSDFNTRRKLEMTKVGINGFGRIGRNVFKALIKNYHDNWKLWVLMI